MPRIGSRQEAAVATEISLTGVYPKGWSNCGNGSWRRTYLSPHRVVYKVARTDWMPEASLAVNRSEFDVIRRFRGNHLAPFSMPAVNKWEIPHPHKDGETIPVIGMQYIERDNSLGWNPWGTDSDLRHKAWLHYKLSDLHSENVYPHKGRLYIIDCADNEVE